MPSGAAPHSRAAPLAGKRCCFHTDVWRKKATQTVIHTAALCSADGWQAQASAYTCGTTNRGTNLPTRQKAATGLPAIVQPRHKPRSNHCSLRRQPSTSSPPHRVHCKSSHKGTWVCGTPTHFRQPSLGRVQAIVQKKTSHCTLHVAQPRGWVLGTTPLLATGACANIGNRAAAVLAVPQEQPRHVSRQLHVNTQFPQQLQYTACTTTALGCSHSGVPPPSRHSQTLCAGPSSQKRSAQAQH